DTPLRGDPPMRISYFCLPTGYSKMGRPMGSTAACVDGRMTRPVPQRWNPMNDSEATRRPVGGLLALSGGLLLCVGTFLDWATVSGGGQRVTARGVDASLGYTTLAAGLVALGVGIVMTRWVTPPEMVGTLAALAIFAGVVGCGIGVYEALMTQDGILDAAATRPAP